MSKQFIAVRDNLFVREKKQERKVGSMIIPDSVDADFTFGIVVSAGEGTFENGNYMPMSVRVGDEVCFPKTMGTKINFAGNEELILVKNSAITAKIDEVDVKIEDQGE